MLDPQNAIFDRRLARHLVSLYYKTRDEEEDELMVSLLMLHLFHITINTRKKTLYHFIFTYSLGHEHHAGLFGICKGTYQAKAYG